MPTTIRTWRMLAVSTLLLLAAFWPGSLGAQSLGEADRAALAGPWRGLWTGGGFVYEAQITLKLGPSGEADGEIVWTLRKTPRANEQSKVGKTGIERVRGRFHADAGILVLDGHAKDDPNGILGLDKYRLAVSDTRKTMGGITWHHGVWDGRFDLSR